MTRAPDPSAFTALRTDSSAAALLPRPSRLFVVSNRVTLPEARMAGGLAQALASLLAERGGTWVGWSGTRADREDVHVVHAGKVQYLTLDVPEAEFEQYYTEYANRTLWPLLHGRTDLVSHKPAARAAYQRVNERFADVLAGTLCEDDVVWVQDYHLIPLAQLLRARGVRCRIGFFLHTPMPSADVFLRVPYCRDLLDALASYDLVGLQTQADANALTSALKEILEATEGQSSKLHLVDGRTVVVRPFGVGIDVSALESLAGGEPDETVTALERSLGDRRLLISVDRLDYSKGIPERIAAYARLLEMRPDLRRRLTFLQIAPESRSDVPEYRRLSRNVQRRVGRVNGRFGDETWTPLRYVNRTYSHAALAGFYRVAKVGVVTPLRDGMNLVAKEYLACQNPDDPGVLVLSEFAGAARELDSALQVNPLDFEGCAAALGRALAMPVDERRERWLSAMSVLRANTVHDWGVRFLDALNHCRGRVLPESVPTSERVASLVDRRRRIPEGVTRHTLGDVANDG